MQQITISGYLSKDAEQQATRGGEVVTRWNIPVKQGWGESEQTNWFRVNIWGKRADFAGKAHKGDFATVVGELTIGEYNGKPQYEIRASDFQAVRMGPKEDRPQGATGGGGGRARSFADDLDDDVPYLSSDSIW